MTREEQVTQAIDTFSIENSSLERLSNAWKLANTQQDYFRINSQTHKLLEKFKSILLKEIRAQCKAPSIKDQQ